MKKLIAAGVAIVALGAAVPLLAGADEHRRGGHKGEGMHAMKGHHGYMSHGRGGRHGAHGRGGRRGMMRMLDTMETFDTDGDGSITQAEVDEWRAARLSEFDADANGTLSVAEYERLWLDAMRERMVDAFQRHDDDGDGEVTVEEFSEPTKRMVMMRDRNGDGVLNMDDMRRRGGGRSASQPPEGDDSE